MRVRAHTERRAPHHVRRPHGSARRCFDYRRGLRLGSDVRGGGVRRPRYSIARGPLREKVRNEIPVGSAECGWDVHGPGSVRVSGLRYRRLGCPGRGRPRARDRNRRRRRLRRRRRGRDSLGRRVCRGRRVHGTLRVGCRARGRFGRFGGRRGCLDRRLHRSRSGWVCFRRRSLGRCVTGRRCNIARLRSGRLFATRRRFGARRQEQERIHVSLRIGRHAQAEVHECLSTRRPDDCAFRDRGTALDLDRAKMKQRCRVAERRLDRDRLPAARNRAGKRHRPVRWRAHGHPFGRADVDPPMLSARVWMRGVENERA